MEKTELKAAQTMLDKGVVIEVGAPPFFRLFGKKRIKLHVKPLRSGVLYRITEEYLKMDIDIEKIGEMDTDASMRFFRKHAKAVCRIAATAMLGYWGGKLWTRPLAGYLFRQSKPSELCMLFYSILMFSGMEDFLNTIRLASTMKMTSPRNLSPEEQGS